MLKICLHIKVAVTVCSFSPAGYHEAATKNLCITSCPSWNKEYFSWINFLYCSLSFVGCCSIHKLKCVISFLSPWNDTPKSAIAAATQFSAVNLKGLVPRGREFDCSVYGCGPTTYMLIWDLTMIVVVAIPVCCDCSDGGNVWIQLPSFLKCMHEDAWLAICLSWSDAGDLVLAAVNNKFTPSRHWWDCIFYYSLSDLTPLLFWILLIWVW